MKIQHISSIYSSLSGIHLEYLLLVPIIINYLENFYHLLDKILHLHLHNLFIQSDFFTVHQYFSDIILGIFGNFWQFPLFSN